MAAICPIVDEEFGSLAGGRARHGRRTVLTLWSLLKGRLMGSVRMGRAVVFIILTVSVGGILLYLASELEPNQAERETAQWMPDIESARAPTGNEPAQELGVVGVDVQHAPADVSPSPAAGKEEWTSVRILRLADTRDFSALAQALQSPPIYGQDAIVDGAWIEAMRAWVRSGGAGAADGQEVAVGELRRLLAAERTGLRGERGRIGFMVHLVEALGDSGDERAAKDLMSVLDDPSQPVVVRSAAAVSLSRAPRDGLVQALERYHADLEASVERVRDLGGDVFELSQFLEEADFLRTHVWTQEEKQ
jgi:hypothetical protein